MHGMADLSMEDGPQTVAPVDEHARAILDGFRMCARRAAPRG